MRHLLVPLILLVGCGPKDDDTGAGAISFDDSAYYDPNVLLEVAITLPESDFDALRQQTRDIMDIIGGADCLDEPFAKPYTWFSADITVDGETVTNVGVRKKGFIGSLSEEKPGLKIKFDQYVPDQNLAGMERMTFNNNVQENNGVYTNKGDKYPVSKDEVELAHYHSEMTQYDLGTGTFTPLLAGLIAEGGVMTTSEGLQEALPGGRWFLEEQNSGELWVVGPEGVFYHDVHASHHDGHHHLPNWTRVLPAFP